MNRILYDAEHIVAPDGTLSIAGLEPGQLVTIALYPIPDAKDTADLDEPRLEGFNSEGPDDPAIDPNESDSSH